MKTTWKWITYTFIVAFATYWIVNFLLWYPWSYNAYLGITLMFVAITPFWFYSVFNCLKRYTGMKILHGAIFISLIFTVVAIVLDYIFYGVIRNAMTELYHPTTFYGYAFLLSLPFIEVLIFNKKLLIKEELKNKEFLAFGMFGLTGFLAITLIIIFDIRLSPATFQFISMIIASLIIFIFVLWIIIGSKDFKNRVIKIVLLSVFCVVAGMLFGKYGANWGLKWWIYYPVPMLMTVLLPPFVLKMNRKQILLYLLLSFLSAPFIHTVFSFFFNWNEYMPFLDIPFFKELV